MVNVLKKHCRSMKKTVFFLMAVLLVYFEKGCVEMTAEIQFRFAVREDVPLIFKFIRDLAAYENLLDKVVVTENILEDWLFVQQKAEVIFCELAGKPIGFTLFFYNFSTFKRTERSQVFSGFAIFISPLIRECCSEIAKKKRSSASYIRLTHNKIEKI